MTAARCGFALARDRDNAQPPRGVVELHGAFEDAEAEARRWTARDGTRVAVRDGTGTTVARVSTDAMGRTWTDLSGESATLF